MCQIINMSFFIGTQKFYLCQVSDCLSFPQILHAKGCSFWTSHTQYRLLSLVSLRSSFNPWSHFVVLTKQNINLLSAKFQEWANPLIHAVSLLFRVSGRWVRPWFPTVIGPFHDELILLLLLPESLMPGLCFLGQTRALFFKPGITCDQAPKNKKGRRTAWLQVKLFAEIS